MEDRDFKGVWIPKEIYLDKELNALDKIIFTEIDSLDNGDGCYASNKYLADFCQCSETKVSTAISKLIQKGYVKLESFNGRSRNLKSSLSNFERQTFKKCKADSQKLKAINIDYQNSLLRESNNIPPCIPPEGKPKRFVKPTLEEVKEYCLSRGNGVDPQRFIDYYEASGWKRGRTPIKDWKACVRTWEKNDKPRQRSFADMAAEIEREMNDTSGYF